MQSALLHLKATRILTPRILPALSGVSHQLVLSPKDFDSIKAHADSCSSCHSVKNMHPSQRLLRQQSSQAARDTAKSTGGWSYGASANCPGLKPSRLYLPLQRRSCLGVQLFSLVGCKAGRLAIEVLLETLHLLLGAVADLHGNTGGCSSRGGEIFCTGRGCKAAGT